MLDKHTVAYVVSPIIDTISPFISSCHLFNHVKHNTKMRKSKFLPLYTSLYVVLQGYFNYVSMRVNQICIFITSNGMHCLKYDEFTEFNAYFHG